MKKFTVLLVALALVITLVPGTVSAQATDPTKTKVKGIVTNDGKPVKNANVTVICKNIARYDVTDANGKYAVTYNKDKCPVGSTVTVTATKNRKGGTSSGKVTAGDTNVNLVLLNVAVPEFGLITGAGATIAGVGALLYVRRRQQAAANLA